MNKHKETHRNSDTKTGNREPHQTTALERSVLNYWRLTHNLWRQPHLRLLCKQLLRIGRIRTLNGFAGRLFGAATQEIHKM